MIYKGTLNEMLNQSFNYCSRSDTFMQASVERTVSDPDFVSPAARFARHRRINALEEELKRELQVTKKIP